MPIDVRMPKLSDNMEEGTIIRWMKGPGDQVEKGEPLAEVETDKADVELEASESGVLREIRVAEGQSAAVGAVIAVLGDAGEGESAKAKADGEPKAAAKPTSAAEDESGGDDKPTVAPGRKTSSPAADTDGHDVPAGRASRASRATTDEPKRASEPRPVAAARPTASVERVPAEQPVRASPLAWRLAEDAGVNLNGVRGSGPGGRIVKRDVEAAVRAPTVAATERAPAVAKDDDDATAPTSETGTRIEPVSRMRAAIARRMSEAKRDIPHFYVTAEIDMTEAMHLRESIKRREAMPGLTVTHLLIRALAMALERHPRVNASWRDDGIELHDDVNIGIAVAVEDGLIVPVLHRAQAMSLSEIAAAAAALTEKARQGRFGGEDLSGGTFSLSNVGMLDVEELVAVINPPQAAILAVGAVKDRPIVRDGQLAVAKTLRATLSCDHRVLNGVEGGRFLEDLKGILENPVTLLLE